MQTLAKTFPADKEFAQFPRSESKESDVEKDAGGDAEYDEGEYDALEVDDPTVDLSERIRRSQMQMQILMQTKSNVAMKSQSDDGLKRLMAFDRIAKAHPLQEGVEARTQ